MCNTLNTTAVLHETYLKLADRPDIEWQGREHFFAVASTEMRALIIDEIRLKASQKRGGDWVRTTLDVSAATASHAKVELLSLDDALDRLGRWPPRSSVWSRCASSAASAIARWRPRCRYPRGRRNGNGARPARCCAGCSAND